MIYTFRLVSDEVDNFMREIKIDADASFLILRNAILDSVGYDKSQLSSFFICDNNWEKEQEITLEDMNTDADKDFYLMDETPLTDFIEDEGQRLIFTFDYMTQDGMFSGYLHALDMGHAEQLLSEMKATAVLAGQMVEAEIPLPDSVRD